MAERAAEGAVQAEYVGPGAQRAAAVLLGLGPDIATSIFRLLDETMVRQIALGAKELKKAPAMVPNALGAFVQALDGAGADALAGDGLLREMASRTLGPDAVRRAFDGVAAPPPIDEALGAIAHADPEALATILSREQPQAAALVLASLDNGRATAVMKHIPESLRPQILWRLATLDAVAPEVLREVGQALSNEINASVAFNARRVDGKSAAVQLLRRCPAAQQTEVVSEIEKEDPELAADLRTKLFTFEDLSNLSDRDLQTLIREIDMGQLAVALKGASPAVKDKILKNMSSRAAQMLNDDIGAMGPVKLAAVEAAQAELVKTAFGLAEQGRITVVAPGEKML